MRRYLAIEPIRFRRTRTTHFIHHIALALSHAEPPRRRKILLSMRVQTKEGYLHEAQLARAEATKATTDYNREFWLRIVEEFERLATTAVSVAPLRQMPPKAVAAPRA